MTTDHIISTQIEIPESTYKLLQTLLSHNPKMDIHDVVSLAILKLAIATLPGAND